MNKHLFHTILTMVLLFACNGKQNASLEKGGPKLEWAPIDSINLVLPTGLQVYHAINVDPNLRAWYVRVDESLPEIETRVVASTDHDGIETVSDFAQRLQVPVVINGGYFRMDLNPAKHVGILKVDGELIHSATPSVLRGEQRFYLHRAAIGFHADDQIDIERVSSHGDSVYSWEMPIENLPGVPGARRDTVHRCAWSYRDILGGGPQLIRDGRIDISVNEEVFFGTSIPQVHPRTAAGITSSGDLILLIVDGRQLISRGVDLEELAEILYDLGCQEAINLDGGGSSALVVNGVLLNRPSGTTTQRQVMSAIAVFAK
ncbi:MAG: phosphodiester glycosidase family protein [Candidatus Marinimicrobia bacterium]|nr:phosphodiester glycosidase family protein [Candidatus Neomarinimicrobiota bacterium]